MFFLSLIAAVAAGVSAPEPTDPGLLVPNSPIMLEPYGSTVGQLEIRFMKPRFLNSRDPIATEPVTGTVVYVCTSEANAHAGIYTDYHAVGTAELSGVFTLAAGTYYVYAISSNANGAGDKSHILEVTVT